jgi:hypothetical protein
MAYGFFERRYKAISVVCSLVFAVGTAVLWLQTRTLEEIPPLATAVEILLYGVLWVGAVWWFSMSMDDPTAMRRMIVPGIVAAIVAFGCIAYGLLARGRGGGHAVEVGLVVAFVVLVKGLLGAIATAVALSVAAYGLLHRDAEYVPLVQELVQFICGYVSVAMEYVVSIVIAAGALANLFTAETGYE